MAADYAAPISPTPYDRPIPGLREPLKVQDPLMPRQAPDGLPELGSSGAEHGRGGLRPRLLPATDPAYAGGKHYWQSDPLYQRGPLDAAPPL